MSDCILWEGRVAVTGYGVVSSSLLAHRAAWADEHGPIADGMQIHHVCGVRLCVNTQHMQLLSAAAHSRLHGPPAEFWTFVEINRAKTHCPSGHEYTPENTILKRGSRHCRQCAIAYNRAYYAKNRERLLPQMRERSKRLRIKKEGVRG